MAYYKKSYPKTPSDGKRRGNPNWNPSWKKGPEVIPGSQYREILSPSAEQEAIFDAVLNDTAPLVISAYAGCGKTSSCAEAMHRTAKKNPSITQGYLIYAKRNATEAIGKCPAGVSVSTAHAFSLRALGAAFGKIQVDKEKTERIAAALVGGDDEHAELRYHMTRAIDLGKDYLAETEEDIIRMVEKHGIERCDLSEGEFASKVLEGMRTSLKQTNIVSFTDMIYIPVKLGLAFPSFLNLYVDEMQDFNPLRIEMLMRVLGKTGRLIGVGDSFQNILGFQGADRLAIQKIQEMTGAKSLSLHKTFRCGKAIVEYAKQYVPDYEAAETNPEGEVVASDMGAMMDENGAMPGDFILSRTNAPLVGVAMQLLKQRRKVYIQGKDLGRNLLFMIKRSGAKDVPSFQSWLTDWANAEIARLVAKNPNAKTEHVQDKMEVLENFCEGRTSIEDVKSSIKEMFDEAEPNETHRITCSTVHASKGLERSRVWRLEKSFTIRPRTEEDAEQEKNVAYVSCTRSIDSLFLVK
jgi:superfamily I DNA/RNA helicase